MPIEVASAITELDATWPLGGDPTLKGDDHIRLIKSVLKTTFPNLNAPMTPTPAEVNVLTGGLNKTKVGLANVDNTSDLDKPVSTAQQTALDLKADLASPAFTGNPTAPTPTAGDNDTSIATTEFIQSAIAAIVFPDISKGISDIDFASAANRTVNLTLGEGTYVVFAWYRYYDDNFPAITLTVDGTSVDSVPNNGDPTGTSYISLFGFKNNVAGSRTITISATNEGSAQRIMAVAIRKA